jgi:hypothetical protein
MNKRLVDGERPIIAHDKSSKVAKPRNTALDDPALLVAAQHAPVLGSRPVPVRTVRGNQNHAATPQPFAQRSAVVPFVGNHPCGLLSWAPTAVPPPDSDRGQRFFRQPDFRRGSRVKSDSQRNTAAVDHHHPLRPLAPLGLADCGAPFFAGAKLPSIKDSLHFSCCRSFNSARNVRQIRSQRPCSSHLRSRRQHVEGEGNSLGKSCQRAPLRRIHKMPSSTLRFAAGGRPPRGFFRGRGSKGSIFCHCASVSNRPYRAICPPPWRFSPSRENTTMAKLAHYGRF